MVSLCYQKPFAMELYRDSGSVTATLEKTLCSNVIALMPGAVCSGIFLAKEVTRM